MNTKWHPSFDQWPSAPDRRALNHVQPTSHAPPAAASVNQAMMAIPYTGLFIAASCNSRSSHGQYTRSST
jgi:proteasome lid subunit RPN8/RPN11